jgi:hypothetical protein
MKKLSFTILSCLFGLGLMAQSSSSSAADLKTPQWQVGLVASEVIIPSIAIDASMAITEKQHIGIRVSRPYYQSFNESDLYQRTIWAFKGGFFHKIFIPLDNYDMFTFRHGVRFGYSKLEFDATVWDPYQSNGNTFLEYRDVSFTDQPFSLGYEALIGWQNSYKNLFFEVYFGLSYEYLENASELQAPQYKGETYSLDYLGPGYEYDSGIRPVMGLVIGLTDAY